MNWTDILTAIWIFLPAGLANGTPVFANKIPVINKINYPLDFYKSYKGIRIFGDHKTFRGLITGIIIAILTTYLQKVGYQESTWLQENILINYNEISPIIFGILAGGGALLGDAVKSFFKRRTNIKPGDPWFPLDQIDYIIGGCIFLLPYLYNKPLYIVYIFVFYFLLHIVSTSIGYLLKLKDKPI